MYCWRSRRVGSAGRSDLQKISAKTNLARVHNGLKNSAMRLAANMGLVRPAFAGAQV